MQLYILDKDPVKSAQLIPDKYKFKILIGLGQLICSAGLSNVYKPIAQGKELQQWIKENKYWVFQYLNELLDWSVMHIEMKAETINNLVNIRNDLDTDIGVAIDFESFDIYKQPTHAYFRYVKDYHCSIPSKMLLPIDVCIRQYKKYLEWRATYSTIKGTNSKGIIIDDL